MPKKVEPTTVKPGEGFTGTGMPENDIFYFHPDHLGSTSYITTKNGSISQHVEYIAFGEVLFEEHSSSFSSPYLFNGKELDRETNLSYYGARYLDMRTSLWLTVDPKMEKYPNYSSYNFCLNNPLKYTDPDGKDIIVISHGRRSKTSIDGGKTNAHAHLVGHMAVLIGNDKTGWTYLSYDYDKGVNKGRGKSGANDVYTEKKFKSLDEFKNSEHNAFKDDYDDGKGLKTAHRDTNGKIIQRYQDAYRIETSADTDATMIAAASATFDKPWAEVSSLGQANQCTTVAERALDAGWLENGEMTPYITIGRTQFGTRNYLPAAKQEGIEKRNGGIDEQIKRTDN